MRYPKQDKFGRMLYKGCFGSDGKQGITVVIIVILITTNTTAITSTITTILLILPQQQLKNHRLWQTKNRIW